MIFLHYFLNNILFWFLENIIIKSLIKKNNTLQSLSE